MEPRRDRDIFPGHEVSVEAPGTVPLGSFGRLADNFVASHEYLI